MTSGQWDQLVLNSPIEEVVGRLLGHITRPAVALADRKRFHDHPGWKRRAADVAHLARPHQIVQRAQRLVLWDVEDWPMDLVEIDPACAQAPE